MQTFLAASVDSGSQENWTGQKRRGRQKGSTSQQQVSSCLSQPRARVLRGHRPEAMEEGESSPAESDSSDQGEATALSRILHLILLHYSISNVQRQNGCRSASESIAEGANQRSCNQIYVLTKKQISNLRVIDSPGDEWVKELHAKVLTSYVA